MKYPNMPTRPLKLPKLLKDEFRRLQGDIKKSEKALAAINQSDQHLMVQLAVDRTRYNQLINERFGPMRMKDDGKPIYTASDFIAMDEKIDSLRMSIHSLQKDLLLTPASRARAKVQVVAVETDLADEFDEAN